MDELNQRPGSLDEELNLARLKDNPKTSARTRAKAMRTLVMTNMAGAIEYMGRICRGAKTREELISLCYQALTRAARNFAAMESPFLHYAKAYLRGEVSRAWERQRVVRNADSSAFVEFCEEALNQARIATFFDELDFQAIETREEDLPLRRCLKRLSPYERQVLRLHYFEGLTFQEIGTRMKVGRSAVQATHAKAVLKMRRFLIRKHRTKRHHEHTSP